MAFLSCIVISGCGESCDYAVVYETKSTDQKLKAVVFQRGCGAAIDSSTHVSILSNEASPGGRGNLFIAGDESRAAPPNKKAPTEIKVSWESNFSLTIFYPKNVEVLLKRPMAAGVAVRYEVVP